MSDVTQILSAIEHGDSAAAAKLLPLVYEELRKLAAAKLAHERPGQTLQATDLVHEAYLRLVSGDRPARWDSRGHFFAAAAESMRRLLVDNARKKLSLRRGGDANRQSLDQVPQLALADTRDEDLIALDDALERLGQLDATKAELVKLRYFVGLTIPQAASALGISTTTANRYWAYARAWLYEELKTDPDSGSP